MLQKIDAWMIDKAEKFSHWTQTWFGIAAPSWERLFLCLCMVDFSTRELSLDWGHTSVVIDVFMMSWWIIRFGLSFFRRSNKLGAELVRNAEKCGNEDLRALGCLIAALTLPVSVWRAFHPPFHSQYWFVYWQVSLVFAACDDLPWGPSKIKKFLQFALAALSWKMPAPEPVADAS